MFCRCLHIVNIDIDYCLLNGIKWIEEMLIKTKSNAQPVLSTRKGECPACIAKNVTSNITLPRCYFQL